MSEYEEDDDSKSLAQSDDAAKRLIDGSRQRKRARLSQKTRYRSMKRLHATTNRVEMLFSRAKIEMTDMHKSITYVFTHEPSWPLE